MNNLKPYIAATALLLTIAIAYGLPRPQYIAAFSLNQLHVPADLTDWRSRDIAGEIKESKDDRYKFLSEVFARVYGTRAGESVLFIILNAGNFHHPKVCFSTSGFQVMDLPDLDITAAGRRLSAKAFHAQKGGQKFLVVYWMVINGQQTDWTGQKLRELFYSLFNKGRTGLMMRMDIPCSKEDVPGAVTLARTFLKDIVAQLGEKERTLIFGERE